VCPKYPALHLPLDGLLFSRQSVVGEVQVARSAKGTKLHEQVQEIILAPFEEVGTLRARPVIKVCRGKIVRVFRPAGRQRGAEEERLGGMPVGFSQ
jgi:hypothetical protein